MSVEQPKSIDDAKREALTKAAAATASQVVVVVTVSDGTVIEAQRKGYAATAKITFQSKQ